MTASSPINVHARCGPAPNVPAAIQTPKARMPAEIENENASFMMTSKDLCLSDTACGGEQLVRGTIEPLVGTLRLVEMTDQFAGKSIDIDPSQLIKFSAIEVEDVSAVHHADVGAIAVENIAAHDCSKRGPGTKLRLLDADSETIRAPHRHFGFTQTIIAIANADNLVRMP